MKRCPERSEEIRALLTAIDHIQPVSDSLQIQGAPLPEQLGGYRVLRELGRGGMGVVYEAEEDALGRRVALKVLPAQATSSPGFLERFRREAQTAAGLQHPNIVMVHGVGSDDGIHFFAMQYIDGQGLDALLPELTRGSDESSTDCAAPVMLTERGEVIDPRAAAPEIALDNPERYRTIAQIGLQVADALGHAHEQGILHRDIKPSNILLDADGHAWISDFGLCQVDEAGDLTASGDLVGTLRYMAPERFGGQTDERSDIYSLGVTLYELLALEPPFRAVDRGQLVHEVRERRLRRLRDVDRDTPRDLETIVHRAIARDPAARYAKAADLADDLRAYLDERPIVARQPTAAYLLWLAVRRNRMLSLTVAAALLVLLSTTLFYVIDLRAAVRLRDESLAQTRALALASASAEATELDPMLGLLLAQEAVRLEQNPLTLSQLHRSLGEVSERHVLRGHAQEVRRVLHSDQGWFISHGRTEVRAWNENGTLLDTLVLGDADYNLVALDRAGGWVAAYSNSRPAELVLWEPTTNTRRMLAMPAPVYELAFSATGSLLAVASAEAVLWIDATTGETEARTPITGVAFSLAFTPDNESVLIASVDRSGGGVVRLLDRSGTNPWRFQFAGSDVAAMCTPDGNKIVVRNGRKACICDLTTGVNTQLSGHRDRVSSIDISGDGRFVVTGSADQTARLWSITGELLSTLQGHGGAVNVVRLNHDGTRVLTASTDQSVCVWDRHGVPLQHLRGHEAGVSDVILSPDENLAITGSTDTTVRVWNLQSPELPVMRGHEQGLYTAAFDVSGQHVVTCARDGTARVFDGNGRPILTIPHEETVYSACFLPDGKHVFTTTAAPVAYIWNLDGEQVQRIDSPARRILTGCFDHPDGEAMFIARSHGNEAIVMNGAGEISAHLVGHEKMVWGAHVSSDCKRIVTCGFDRTARLWHVTGEPIAVLQGHDGASVNAARFSRDTNHIVTACDDGTARIWDGSGQCLAILRGHEGPVLSAIFSPDGAQILTASRDQTARLWDRTGAMLTVFAGHQGVVWSAEFSTDGRRIVTSSFDHTARTWLAHPADLIRAASERAARDFTDSERKRYGALLGTGP